MDWILIEEGQLHEIENYFEKRAKGEVMCVAGKRSLPVSLECRDQIMRVLHRSLVGSIDRAHNVVLRTKKEIDIRIIELEATASRVINESL